MTDLNEYECEMLDTLLAAFGVPDSLTRGQLMELFDGDEAVAFAMVQALAREGLVAEKGKPGHYELPEKLILKPKGEKFLKEGGFTKRHRAEQQQPTQVGGTLAKLQQQNMRLQNEKLANQSQVADLNKTIKALQTRQYIMFVLIIIALIVGYWLAKTI
ncbi:MAG: hypothetical protein V4553_06670 [Bacteroidota bacterium]